MPRTKDDLADNARLNVVKMSPIEGGRERGQAHHPPPAGEGVRITASELLRQFK
jgi:hypothetical protein